MRKPEKQYILSRPYAQVGAYLAKLRSGTGLTQRQVARRIEYSSPQFLSNFERGIALPPLRKLRTLLRLYRGDVNETLRLILAAEREILLEGLRSNRQR